MIEIGAMTAMSIGKQCDVHTKSFDNVKEMKFLNEFVELCITKTSLAFVNVDVH